MPLIRNALDASPTLLMTVIELPTVPAELTGVEVTKDVGIVLS